MSKRGGWSAQRVRAPALVACAILGLWSTPGSSHHVLGRPSYSLNEDSNTPPAIQVETELGPFFVSYMAFPAFPRPNQPGRIHLYISRSDNGEPYRGEVTFRARRRRWLGSQGEKLGVQPPDDSVFRQGFLFHEAGSYLVTASFESDGERYEIDLPLRIGEPWPVGPTGIGVIVLAVAVVAVTVLRHRQLRLAKLRDVRGRTRA